MSAPSGKPSPEGTRPSGVVQAIAIEDADTDKAANEVPIGSDAQTPSEGARSDKREVNALTQRGAILPHSDTTRFSHRGYDIHASREGMPASSAHMHMNQTEVHHHETSEMHNTMDLQQVQLNEMHVNTHDPAITYMVDQVAEARHREALANTEHVVQTMVSQMSRRFHAEEKAASARMHQWMKLADWGSGKNQNQNK